MNHYKSDIKAYLQKPSEDILSSQNDFQNERYQEFLNEKALEIIQLLERVQ